MGPSREQPEVGRLGLTLVYPDPAESASFTPTVNVIFVHGLRGHPLKTWSYREDGSQTKPDDATAKSDGGKRSSKKHKSSRPRSRLGSLFSDNSSPSSSKTSKRPSSSKVFWPSQVLPGSLPNARIWTYGYDSEVVRGLFQANNQNSILQHGNDLMVKVVRTVKGDEPIIFVAHSLGGLLVKVAFRRMCHSRISQETQTFRRVKAIVFCGTPHRGSGTASWGLLASNLVSAALTDANSKILKNLEINDDILRLIQDDFLRVLPQPPIRIHSFQEGKPSSGIKGLNSKVVDEFSSVCDAPLEVVETINADHRQMVKGPGVKVICDVLRDIESHILEPPVQEDEPSTSQPTKQQSGPSVDAYTYLDRFFTVDYYAFLLSVPQRHPKTCTWLSESKEVQAWISEKKSRVLWIRGYPGCGKSVVARHLIESLEKGHPGSQNRASYMLNFFFFADKDERARTSKSFVSSMIHQLVSKDPRLALPIQSKYVVIERSVTDSLSTLWELFLDVCNAIEKGTLYIVIDALDELERASWATFLDEFLNVVSKSKTIIKVIITSRHEPEVEKALSPRPILINLRNSSDVATYLRDTVLEYGRENGFRDGACRTILNELNTRAEGMFLWAKLAWSYFTDGVAIWDEMRIQEKVRAIQELPPEMDSLYYRILSAIDKRLRGEVLQVFKWLVVAARPLTITEISIALGFRHRPQYARDVRPRLNMRSFFKKFCPHLVKVDEKDTITLVHQSFKDFLIQTTEIAYGACSIPNEFFIDYDATRHESGLDCLAYLALLDFDDEDKLFDPKPLIRDDLIAKYQFLDYSRFHWASHLEGVDDGIEVWQYFTKILRGPDRRIRWEPVDPAIFYLFRHGLDGLLRRVAENRVDMNQVNSDGDHIIHVAARDINVVQLERIEFLLGLDVDINGRDASGQTMLHRFTRTEVVDGMRQWLLYPGVDINAQDSRGETALHAAVRTEISTKEILDVLLALPDIDINVQDFKGLNPLCLALHWGRERAVSRLLQMPNIDVSSSSDNESPLINATIQGWHGVALLILDKLDNVDNFRDNVGRSVLHWAAYMNMPEVFRIALDKQTILLEAVDVKGWTPLHSIADDGNIDIVELLLERGASTTAVTNFKETALHIAASKGHLSVVRLLLGKMPAFAINAKDHNGWTALHRSLSANRDDMTLWMLEQEVVNLARRDKHGRRAIMFAAGFASKSVLRAFLQRTPEDVSIVDSFGYTLLHMAAFSGNIPNTHFLLSFDVMDPKAENSWGKRPLDLSPTDHFTEFLSSLGFTHSRTHLEQKAKLDQQKVGYTYSSRTIPDHSGQWALAARPPKKKKKKVVSSH